jgi:hypothetical protein
MRRKIAGAALIAVGLGLSLAPAATAQGKTDHREVVCHKTGSGYIAIPPAKASSHITSDGERERGHEGDFLLKETYNPKTDGKWNEVKPTFNKLCNDAVVVTPPPTTTTVTLPPETVTETVRPPKVTVTETAPTETETEVATPTETVTVTGEPTTVTETVTPTVTETTTGPPTTVGTNEPGPIVTQTLTLPPTTKTVSVPGEEVVVKRQLPNVEVTKTVDGKVRTTFVDKATKRVVATETTDRTLAYTGINLLYLAVGLILVLLGVIALMGVKLTAVKK